MGGDSADQVVTESQTSMVKSKVRKPIFVVGLPRTGSKLLMNSINNNRDADYFLANEIQFFGHSFLGRVLQGRRGVMPIVDEEKLADGTIDWDVVVERFYSAEAKGVHWCGLRDGWLKIGKEVLSERLAETDGSAKEVYEVILSTQEREFRGYGDKSGPNLYFVDKLMEWFPDGKVIHIIRDPRAILTSQYKRLSSMIGYRSGSGGITSAVKRMALGPVVMTYVLAYWSYAMRIHQRFSKEYPHNYLLVQFERLVLEPEETTKEICRFLDIPWDETMVAPPIRDSSYIDPRDIHVAVERGSGMDREAVDRWRQHIKPWMSRATAVYGRLFHRGDFEQFGYGK